jgi:uncharacterized membrane protein
MPSIPTSPGGQGAGSTRRLPSLSKIILSILEAVFFVAYPFAIYYAHTRLETRSLGIVLIVLLCTALAIRLRGSLREIGDLVKQHAGIGVLILLAVAADSRVYLLFLPAVVSLYLLFTFGASLRIGPPMIERFARMVEDDLPDFTLPYCRRVTWIWCGFFAANALCVVTLALTAPLEWWAVYTGIVFYALLGLLLGVEFMIRKLTFRYYGDGAAELLFARLFPAEKTGKGRRSLAYQAARLRGDPVPISTPR